MLQRYGDAVRPRWRRAVIAKINVGRRTWQAYCHAVNETAAAQRGL